MTDLETIKAMYDRAGVKYTSEVGHDGIRYIGVEAREGPNNRGYAGFVAELVFAADGRLLSVGAWE